MVIGLASTKTKALRSGIQVSGDHCTLILIVRKETEAFLEERLPRLTRGIVRFHGTAIAPPHTAGGAREAQPLAQTQAELQRVDATTARN